MSRTSGTHQSALTDYEAEQVRRIAAWKSEPPNPLGELWKRISLPVAKVVEKVIPDRVVRDAITWSYDISERLAGSEDVKRRAGVSDLAELHAKPLEVCDRLAIEVGVAAEALAAVEGAATGAGGALTTLLDVPLLFILGLRTIRKIGHCYGYPLEGEKDRHLVLGVMIAAMAGTLEIRRERINRLRELEDLLIEESEEEVVTEEALSFLFQLEVFEEVPGVGAVSGGVLNWFFMRRVGQTSRMVFEERWLRDNGKVEEIEPAAAHARALTGGWIGALNRTAYAGGYYLGFGASLPVHAVAALIGPRENALTRGLREGAAAAVEEVDRLVGWSRDRPLPSPDGHGTAPALAPS